METTVAERKTKLAHELVRGDWIHTGGILNFNQIGVVRHVETRPTDGGGRVSTLMYHPAGYDEPTLLHVDADRPVKLLTEDEMAAAMDAERRDEIARQFVRLADLVRRTDFPLPALVDAIDVDFDFGADVSKVEAFARALHAEVESSRASVRVIHHGGGERSAGVDIIGRAKQAAEAKTRCVASLHVPAQFPDARCFRCGATGVIAAFEPDPAADVVPVPAEDATRVVFRRPDGTETDNPAEAVSFAMNSGVSEATMPAEDATLTPPARANEPWLNRKPLGEAECGCPVYPYPEGRGSADDEIVDHRDTCTANDEERTEAVPF